MVIEGGAYICYTHEYETGSTRNWDKHMSDTYHPLHYTQQCVHCKEQNFEVLPHPPRYVERKHSNKPEDKDFLVLKCKNCNLMCR